VGGVAPRVGNRHAPKRRIASKEGQTATEIGNDKPTQATARAVFRIGC
jgi:hypothetical protein